MTLVFLGDVEPPRAAAVVDAMSRSVAQPPIDLTFAGFGIFPLRGSPRALWIGLRDGEAALRELQATIASRISDVGVALENRPFSPHLTLARWKMSRPADRSRLSAAMHARTIARTRIDCATLFESRVSSKGPAYTALARATLSG